MTFQLLTPGRILFGRGALAEALPHLRALGDRPLLIHSPSAAEAATLAADLRAAGAAVETRTTRGEPDLPALTELLAAARALRPDAVIAMGGGAALDMGKALAALIPGSGDPLRHLEVVGEGRPLDAAPLPFAAIPTTSGTGSEATKNAVIGVPEAARKVSLRDDRMIARLAVVDPALTEAVPAPVQLASGLDAVVQVIEPYISAKANPLTDALCADAIPRGLTAIRRVMEAPDARAFDDMALVSLTGGIALANAGLGAVHGLAGVLGGRIGAAHGALCGRLLVPVLRANFAAMDGPRPERVLGWIARAFDADRAGALDALEAWIDAQGLPRLAEMGLAAGDHGAVAEEAGASSSMKGNPVALSRATLEEVLGAA
ncbi:iron-containing alcohol dehydrogenase [Jannaschia sp. GRR-S6-38]|uniref:Iron-containing alcohol dehydrogenase n=2 Tax=Jannaschia ovalis TaxID=3038773 RepID=A0ABY8LI42_9RHOB|nr:iron-containing alcohol dehydrogenase [Jannaschia sp. GRR-S6-38]WGH80327.1 iron-containing alcohol dehydrogenase [Jannaschia sp. GRR-S6-38]